MKCDRTLPDGATEALAQPRAEAFWERPVAPPEGGETAMLVRITAPSPEAAGRRAPVDVAFVLDRSGSMAHGKLELAKTGVDLATAHLRDVDRAALIVYDDEVDTPSPLAFTTPRVKAGLRLALHGIDPGGSTFLSGGWMAGCQALAEAPAVEEGQTRTRIRRVILLTDGLANVGIAAPRELAQHAGALRRRGIATTTIGVGQDFDEGLLSAMAEAGGGHFQYAADAEALRAFFSDELRQMASVAATGLEVRLTLSAALRGELISVFPVEESAGTMTVAIGDLHAEATIELVFVLRATPGTIGEEAPMGIAVAWTDPRTDQRHDRDISPAALRWVGAEDAVGTIPDPQVVEQAALQCAAAERRAGLELDRQGDYRGSRRRMALSRDLLAAAPMTMRVREDLAESESLSAAPPTMAYDSHTRKSTQWRQDRRRRGRIDDAGRGAGGE